MFGYSTTCRRRSGMHRHSTHTYMRATRTAALLGSGRKRGCEAPRASCLRSRLSRSAACGAHLRATNRCRRIRRGAQKASSEASGADRAVHRVRVVDWAARHKQWIATRIACGGQAGVWTPETQRSRERGASIDTSIDARIADGLLTDAALRALLCVGGGRTLRAWARMAGGLL